MIVWSSQPWKKNLLFRFFETVSRFENLIPFVFRFFADLAGVEGPWVPLMLGDAPSLLEHLESNLKSNEFSKLSLAVRLRVIACYRDRFVCVFSFPIPHPPVRLSLSLILSTLPSLLVFLVGFSSFSFRLAPAEEVAGIVPLSSQFQRGGSYIPSGLSGREPKLPRYFSNLGRRLAIVAGSSVLGGVSERISQTRKTRR
jgi:hypothetical protein